MRRKILHKIYLGIRDEKGIISIAHVTARSWERHRSLFRVFECRILLVFVNHFKSLGYSEGLNGTLFFVRDWQWLH